MVALHNLLNSGLKVSITERLLTVIVKEIGDVTFHPNKFEVRYKL